MFRSGLSCLVLLAGLVASVAGAEGAVAELAPSRRLARAESVVDGVVTARRSTARELIVELAVKRVLRGPSATRLVLRCAAAVGTTPRLEVGQRVVAALGSEESGRRAPIDGFAGVWTVAEVDAMEALSAAIGQLCGGLEGRDAKAARVELARLAVEHCASPVPAVAALGLAELRHEGAVAALSADGRRQLEATLVQRLVASAELDEVGLLALAEVSAALGRARPAALWVRHRRLGEFASVDLAVGRLLRVSVAKEARAALVRRVTELQGASGGAPVEQGAVGRRAGLIRVLAVAGERSIEPWLIESLRSGSDRRVLQALDAAARLGAPASSSDDTERRATVELDRAIRALVAGREELSMVRAGLRALLIRGDSGLPRLLEELGAEGATPEIRRLATDVRRRPQVYRR